VHTRQQEEAGKLLLASKEYACPRRQDPGTESMKLALHHCVAPGSMVVHDCWWATHHALEELAPTHRFREAPAVNHSKGFRTFVPKERVGWHSNDAESEINRLRLQHRQRYGRLQTRGWGPQKSGDLYEYIFPANNPDMDFAGLLRLIRDDARTYS
jgi:hypothetical protein